MGIYKRKQVSQKKRKQELDQENDQENKNKGKKHAFDQENRKKLSFFLDHFLSRVLVFLFSYFFVFFYKFPPLRSILSLSSALFWSTIKRRLSRSTKPFNPIIKYQGTETRHAKVPTTTDLTDQAFWILWWMICIEQCCTNSLLCRTGEKSYSGSTNFCSSVFCKLKYPI